MHVISLDPPMRLDEKPPDYASVMDVPPPSYDDAIKLDPQRLIAATESGRPRTMPDGCAVAVPLPDECDKIDSRRPVQNATASVPDAAEHHQQQPSTTLAQAIRKSIRDMRKQLTNTVSDVATDIEQHQQQNSTEHNATGCSCTVVDDRTTFKPEMLLR